MPIKKQGSLEAGACTPASKTEEQEEEEEAKEEEVEASACTHASKTKKEEELKHRIEAPTHLMLTCACYVCLWL